MDDRPQVVALVQDMSQRLADWPWWTDALYVEAMSPAEQGRCRVHQRVYLVGPAETAADDLPVVPYRAGALNENAWKCLLLGDALDFGFMAQVVGDSPLGDNRLGQFFTAHTARRVGECTRFDAGWTNHPDLSPPGSGKVLVDDVEWVADAITRLPLSTPSISAAG